jgi:hypothetical protein
VAKGRPDRSAASIGVAVVLGVLVITALGGYAVASVLEEPSGEAVTFEGVRIQPLSGWAVAGTGAGEGWAFVRLTRGSGTLDVAVRPGGSSEGEGAAAVRYVNEILRRSLARLAVSQLESVATSSGLRGVRFTYTGVLADTRQTIEGEVTVAVTDAGNAVAFDAWTQTGLLPFVLTDVHAMVDRLETA